MKEFLGVFGGCALLMLSILSSDVGRINNLTVVVLMFVMSLVIFGYLYKRTSNRFIIITLVVSVIFNPLMLPDFSETSPVLYSFIYVMMLSLLIYILSGSVLMLRHVFGNHTKFNWSIYKNHHKPGQYVREIVEVVSDKHLDGCYHAVNLFSLRAGKSLTRERREKAKDWLMQRRTNFDTYVSRNNVNVQTADFYKQSLDIAAKIIHSMADNTTHSRLEIEYGAVSTLILQTYERDNEVIDPDNLFSDDPVLHYLSVYRTFVLKE